jgi:hypothetical protein
MARKSQGKSLDKSPSIPVFNDMFHIRLQRFARGLREHSSNA